jgi:hypothetical protein
MKKKTPGFWPGLKSSLKRCFISIRFNQKVLQQEGSRQVSVGVSSSAIN